MRITRFSISSAAIAALLLAPAVCSAQGSKRANAKADAWLGRDASELLMQLRVDGGRVDIEENDETGETSYTWSTWNPAWTEVVQTGGGVVGVVPGGRGVAPTPIFAPTQTHQIDHPATHRCDITFHANAEGIIHRWVYTGDRCSRDIERPED